MEDQGQFRAAQNEHIAVVSLHKVLGSAIQIIVAFACCVAGFGSFGTIDGFHDACLMVFVRRKHLHTHLVGFLTIDAGGNRATCGHEAHAGVFAELGLNFIEHGLLHVDKGNVQVAKQSMQGMMM